MWPIPGYTPTNDHVNYAASVPAKFHKHQCRADNCPDYSMRDSGFTYQPETGYWVHAACGRPRPIWQYIERCWMCNELYLVEHYPDEAGLCPECK